MHRATGDGASASARLGADMLVGDIRAGSASVVEFVKEGTLVTSLPIEGPGWIAIIPWTTPESTAPNVQVRLLESGGACVHRFSLPVPSRYRIYLRTRIRSWLQRHGLLGESPRTVVTYSGRR